MVEAATRVTYVDTADDAAGPFYLTPQHIIEVVQRLGGLLAAENSVRLGLWLCVRYFETGEAITPEPQGTEMKRILPPEVVLTTVSCNEFGDVFFGLVLDDVHKHFNVFNATSTSASQVRWPISRGGNKWPVQSFWQRFKELAPHKDAHKLFDYSHAQRKVTIATKRGTEALGAFTDTVLSSEGKGVRLNVLDLAEWLARGDAWPQVPRDAEVVARFLQRIWIEDSEHPLFDSESQNLLIEAKKTAL